MSEELRFFLRTALYTALVGSVYWFVSYEWAGTFLLAALGLSAFVFVIVIGTLVPRARRFPERASESVEEAAPEPGGEPPARAPTAPATRPAPVGLMSRKGAMLRRTLGFADHPDDEMGGTLELEDDLFPTASIWPLVLATACTLIGLGLVFGAWLWVPGAGLFLAAGISWLTQLTP